MGDLSGNLGISMFRRTPLLQKSPCLLGCYHNAPLVDDVAELLFQLNKDRSRLRVRGPVGPDPEFFLVDRLLDGSADQVESVRVIVDVADGVLPYSSTERCGESNGISCAVLLGCEKKLCLIPGKGGNDITAHTFFTLNLKRCTGHSIIRL